MQIATIPGETYAVTVTSPCTVCAVMPKSSPLLLITIEDPGQYLVVAPTTALYIDDDSALVTRSFKSAPVGMFSRRFPPGAPSARNPSNFPWLRTVPGTTSTPAASRSPWKKRALSAPSPLTAARATNSKKSSVDEALARRSGGGSGVAGRFP